jgi:hypothetical protein
MEISQRNCMAILDKQKIHYFFSFTKSENRRVEQVLSRGGWYQWERGGCGERV